MIRRSVVAEEAVPGTLVLGAPNSGRAFWRFIDVPESPDDSAQSRLDAEVEAWLSEARFGSRRYELGVARRAYYLARRFIPRGLRVMMRRGYQQRDVTGPLGWPIETGFVELRERQALAAMSAAGLDAAEFVDFWPDGFSSAFVVTHDVETREGLDKTMQLARIDARYGIRSSFNLVPERYKVDAGLRHELEAMGFEVGLHGLKHDGLLYWSKGIFSARAKAINRYALEWGAKGFRSPMTHRNPEWMQELRIEYDSSFFDTDPFEPMPGGTGSIWPYHCGGFIELPYTLPQDSTLFELMQETDAEVWLRKLDFVAASRGMALVNVHPDYTYTGGRLRAYEALLDAALQRGCWNAWPRDVAEWWRSRSSIGPGGPGRPVPPGSPARIARAERAEGRLVVIAGR